ncbi:hypothetical protein HPB50_017433 [Hyalomma asiaticum]|uniref:Uncharacterized protein n=1 Tax=Hyalomma asiaticum TaxID=266040 RepID=A0ACB7SG10_HYAAI|nr:hypothetical protein HPB50_017433 [Hyalomma asiaticum]
MVVGLGRGQDGLLRSGGRRARERDHGAARAGAHHRHGVARQRPIPSGALAAVRYSIVSIVEHRRRPQARPTAACGNGAEHLQISGTLVLLIGPQSASPRAYSTTHALHTPQPEERTAPQLNRAATTTPRLSRRRRRRLRGRGRRRRSGREGRALATPLVFRASARDAAAIFR